MSATTKALVAKVREIAGAHSVNDDLLEAAAFYREVADCLESTETEADNLYVKLHDAEDEIDRLRAEVRALRIVAGEAQVWQAEHGDELLRLRAEVERLTAEKAYTHSPDCLSRVPDFDVRDCNCRAVRAEVPETPA